MPGHGCEPGAVVYVRRRQRVRDRHVRRGHAVLLVHRARRRRGRRPGRPLRPGPRLQRSRPRRLQPARRGLHERHRRQLQRAHRRDALRRLRRAPPAQMPSRWAARVRTRSPRSGANDTFATSCSVSTPSAAAERGRRHHRPRGAERRPRVWAHDERDRGGRRDRQRRCGRRHRRELGVRLRGRAHETSGPARVQRGAGDVLRRRHDAVVRARASSRSIPAPAVLAADQRRLRERHPPSSRGRRPRSPSSTRRPSWRRACPPSDRRAHLLVHPRRSRRTSASTRPRSRAAARPSLACATRPAPAPTDELECGPAGPGVRSTSAACRRAPTSSPSRRPRPSTRASTSSSRRRRDALPTRRAPRRRPSRRRDPRLRSLRPRERHQGRLPRERPGRRLRPDACRRLRRAPHRSLPADRHRRRVARHPGLHRRDHPRVRDDGTPARVGKRNVAAGDYRVVVADQLGLQGTLEPSSAPRSRRPSSSPGRRGRRARRPSTRPSGGFFTGDTSTSHADYASRCDAPGAASAGRARPGARAEPRPAAAGRARHGGLARTRRSST